MFKNKLNVFYLYIYIWNIFSFHFQQTISFNKFAFLSPASPPFQCPVTAPAHNQNDIKFLERYKANNIRKFIFSAGSILKARLILTYFLRSKPNRERLSESNLNLQIWRRSFVPNHWLQIFLLICVIPIFRRF